MKTTTNSRIKPFRIFTAIDKNPTFWNNLIKRSSEGIKTAEITYHYILALDMK